jgi:hypothetical protein
MTQVAILLPTYLHYAQQSSSPVYRGTDPWTTYAPLETQCSARVTLTWLAMASTRVSGTSASEAMAVDLDFNLQERGEKGTMRLQECGGDWCIPYLNFHAR